jgi:predicted ATPase
MITGIQISNFKCFRELDLPITPFTLLAGLNGMGKSSVFQALLLLRQSFISGDLDARRLLLGGDLVDLGTGSNILFVDASSDEIAISLSVTGPDGDVVSVRFPFQYDRQNDRLRAVVGTRRNSQSTAEAVVRQCPPLAGRVTYLCAERHGPRKMLPLSESRVSAFDLGIHGEYVLHFLLIHGSTMLPDNDLRLLASGSTRLSDQLDSRLQEISPGSHLDIEAVRNADGAIAGYAFDRAHDVKSPSFRATNVGFGLSYVLPVLVALLSTPPGGLLLIENPEAHMHPRGQTVLGRLAAAAAASGVQVIVETHSDHFMDGVRIAVHDGLLHPAQCSFHYFARQGIEAHVTSPQIDLNGRLSSWPAGFFDQQESNLERLLVPRPQT